MRAPVLCAVACAVVCACACALADPGFSITWFDVGQGDSQFIVFPSGFSILVDMGELKWNSARNAQAVANKIRNATGGSFVNVAVISHYHSDHLGEVGYGGLWYLIEVENIEFGRIIDRDAGVWLDLDGNGVCNDTTEIVYHNAGETSSIGSLWTCYVTDPTTKAGKIRVLADICNANQINPTDAGASVRVVAANGFGAVTKKGDPLNQDLTNYPNKPSENDYSVGLLVTFGSIKYFTCGDLDGIYDGGDANDVESYVGPRVGMVDIYKVNHHGSNTSSSTGFLATLQPQVSVISVGYNNSYNHPMQTTLSGLNKYGDVFLTEQGDPQVDYTGTHVAWGDVTLFSSDGGNTFTVSLPNGESFKYTGRKSYTPACTL
eukprot:TRINITY_DN33_c2_g1_i17.p2 TRINITY_DN33_c2_g1~~TRINITY_DN33_c2_g1_i17.p2  ORF type:complete len:376 (-),score=90.30 TRINITY_DN33_c2_g1_i17:2810-3937(-)